MWEIISRWLKKRPNDEFSHNRTSQTFCMRTETIKNLRLTSDISSDSMSWRYWMLLTENSQCSPEQSMFLVYCTAHLSSFSSQTPFLASFSSSKKKNLSVVQQMHSSRRSSFLGSLSASLALRSRLMLSKWYKEWLASSSRRAWFRKRTSMVS